MKKVIITGPTGAIGHALIDECIDNDVEIFAVCRHNSRRSSFLPQNKLVHLVEVELADLQSAKKLIPHDCDALYHLAWAGTFGADARNNMPEQIKNIQYTLDAVKLASMCGCKTFIGAGSQAEYGRVEGKLSDKTSTFPDNGYGMAKLCAGQMSRIVAHKLDIKHMWTRILSVYGPYDGDYTMVMSTIHKLLEGEKPSFTKGEQMWDYIYTKDIGGIMFALGGEKSIDGKIYCIGSGTVRPLYKYIEDIRDAIDPKLQLGLGEIPYAPKQVMYLCADNTAIKNELGYTYRYDFITGIRETIEWVKAYKSNK